MLIQLNSIQIIYFYQITHAYVEEIHDTIRRAEGKNRNVCMNLQGYGMTEAGPVLAMCLAFAKEPFEIKSGSCGTVVRNAEMKIVDPDTGHSLPRNQPGEICIRGNQIMKGMPILPNVIIIIRKN